MPVNNFNFFAMSYLNDWFSDDSRFVQGLRSDRSKEDRLKTIHEAAKYYKVNRTLKKLPGERRLERALTVVDIAAESLDAGNVDSVVCSLATTLQAAYGKYALSAASKFLWLLRRRPVVIYDSRALGCLDNTCGGTLGKWCDYADYRARWLAEYEKRAGQIRSACDQVVRVKTFSLAYDVPDDELTLLVQRRWFQERVFDKYLWWNARD